MIEEVVVTATRREVSIQDVPQAISVFTAELMDDIGSKSFSELVEHIPGVELRTAIAGSGDVAMRGISTQNNVQGGPGAAVGLYLDELPLTTAGYFPDIKSFDLERIEVLRGPQGTLFGEGSMAGTIRLISKKPNPEKFEGRAEVTWSDTRHGDDNFIGNAVVNIPLGETAALRVSGWFNDMGGYVDAVDYGTGEPFADNINSSETTGARVMFGWMPNDNLEITLSGFFNDAEQGGFNFGNKDYVWATSVASNLDDEMSAFNLTIDYDFGFANLVSSTSYFDRETTGRRAQDGLLPTVGGLYSLFGLPSAGPMTGLWIDEDVVAESFAQELRLVSNSDGPWQWTVGAFYKEQDFGWRFTGDSEPMVTPEEIQFVSTILIGLPLDKNFLSDTVGTYKQIAGFGEVSYDFNDNWQILLGGRLFREKRDATSIYGGLFPVLLGAFPGELLPPSVSDGDSTLFKPKATLTYTMESGSIVYATIGTGFRSGGQNPFSPLLPGSVFDYDPEELTSYELGFKTTSQDGRVVFNAAIYYMDWKNLQATTIEGPGGALEAQDNVGDAHSAGIDVELAWEPVDGLVFTASGTLLEAETDEAYILGDPAGFPDIAPKGTRIPGVAEKSLNLSAQYNWQATGAWGGFARASYAYVGNSTDILVNPITVESYQIVNARIGFSNDRWSFAVFADNLFDEFITYGKSRENPPTPWVGQYWSVGRPRTIGITASVDF